MSYGLHNPSAPTEAKTWNFNEDELTRCIEFLNLPLKNMKFRMLWNKLKKSGSKWEKVLNLDDTEDFNHELINMIIGVNRFVFKKKGWLIGMAHDQEHTKM